MSSRPIRLVLLPLLALVLGACQNREAQDLRQQNSQLQTQLQGLQAQVQDLQGRVSTLTAQLARAQTAGTSVGGADGNALRAELAWRQAQGYAVAVHAAFQGRMSEDPMYTPERLANEVPDCLKASSVGGRNFGAPPASVTSCSVEPDGANDVRVTVKTARRTFVNGVEE